MKKQFESEHFDIFYNENIFINSEIDLIANYNEESYNKTAKKLEYDPHIRINLKLFETALACGISYDINTPPEKANPINAFCYSQNNIHATYNNEIKAIGCHEIAHLFIENMLNNFPVIQLNEGFSVYCDNYWEGCTISSWINKNISKEKIELYKEIITFEEAFYSNQNISYPILGSFCEWLIVKYGITFFKTLLQESISDKKVHIKYTNDFINEIIMKL